MQAEGHMHPYVAKNTFNMAQNKIVNLLKMAFIGAKSMDKENDKW